MDPLRDSIAGKFVLHLVKSLRDISCDRFRNIFLIKLFIDSMRNNSLVIISGHRKAKTTLFIAQEFAFVEIFSNVLVDVSFKYFTNDTKEAGGAILGQGRGFICVLVHKICHNWWDRFLGGGGLSVLAWIARTEFFLALSWSQ